MRDVLHGDIISYGQPGGFVRLNEVGTLSNLLNQVGFELLVSVEGSLGLPMVHILERKDPRVAGRDYEGSGFPQEVVEWGRAAHGWLETEAEVDSIEAMQAMLADESDSRLAALNERFTATEVELMTYASSPTGGMNPRGHTGHIVFAAGPAGPGVRGDGYFELKTIESTGAAGEHWPATVRNTRKAAFACGFGGGDEVRFACVFAGERRRDGAGAGVSADERRQLADPGGRGVARGRAHRRDAHGLITVLH